MPVNTFTKSLLLISLLFLGIRLGAQAPESVSRNMTYSHFGVPVIAEESGNGMLKIYYQVKPGNTLYSISRQFDLSVEEIRSMNHLANNLIYTGQKLLVRQEVVDDTESEREEVAIHSPAPREIKPAIPATPPATAPIPADASVKEQPATDTKSIGEPSGELILIDNLGAAKPAGTQKTQHSFGQ